MSESQSETPDDADETSEDKNNDEEEERELGNRLDVSFDEVGEGEGLDDPEEPEPTPEPTTTTTSATEVAAESSGRSQQTQSDVDTKPTTQSTTDNSSVSRADLPHRVQADSPKEDREAINMYVSPNDKQRLEELKQMADQEFSETVYKIDVYLAALRSSFTDEHAFLSEMERIGYGYFD
jgi:hypothetical protein